LAVAVDAGGVKRNDRSIASFTALGHGTFHGYELSIPLFVPAWRSAFGATPTELGVAVGAGYALVGLGAPLAGVAADRYGSRRLVVLSIGGMGLAFAALSAVGSVAALAVASMLWGAAASLYHPAGLSLISRGAEGRGTVLAYHGAGGNLGMVIVPVAAAFLLAFFEWQTVTWLLAAPAALCVAAGLVLAVGEATGAARSAPDAGGATLATAAREFLANSRGLFVGGFAVVFAIQMVYGMYYRGIFTFLPGVLAGLPVFEPIPIGGRTVDAGQFAYSGLLLVGVFGQYAGGVFSDRIDPESALVGTFAILVVASALFVPAAEAGALSLLAVCAVLGFFVYAFAPIGQSLVAEYVPEGSHGLSFGYVYLGTFGVGAVGAALTGRALDVGGVRALFGLLVALMVGCLAVAVLLVRTSVGRADAEASETP
jgi:MFS family permease